MKNRKTLKTLYSESAQNREDLELIAEKLQCTRSDTIRFLVTAVANSWRKDPMKTISILYEMLEEES